MSWTTLGTFAEGFAFAIWGKAMPGSFVLPGVFSTCERELLPHWTLFCGSNRDRPMARSDWACGASSSLGRCCLSDLHFILFPKKVLFFLL